MKRIENEDFVVEFCEDGKLKVVMKTAGVEVSIEALRIGMLVYGGGHHPYIAQGRDSGLLVLDRELMGAEQLHELR